MKERKVIIRTDASFSIGWGHLMRCKALAEELRYANCEVIFACASPSNEVITLLENEGYVCCELSSIDADIPIAGDWLIVDHYGLEANWENSMRKKFNSILVIDDLANRKHTCDVFLDQNRIFNGAKAYEGLLSEKTKKLFGPRYALLRREFSRKKCVNNQQQHKRILISFGGSDPTHETVKLLQTIIKKKPVGINIDIVLGAANQDSEKIEKMVSSERSYVQIHKNSTNMAELMCKSDVGIGSGGVTTWERLCCGLPSLLVVVADNQKSIAEEVARFGAAVIIGNSIDVTGELMWDMLTRYLSKPEILKQLSIAGRKLVDGFGCKRVIDVLEDYERNKK